jgi:hypothetical protein
MPRLPAAGRAAVAAQCNQSANRSRRHRPLSQLLLNHHLTPLHAR